MPKLTVAFFSSAVSRRTRCAGVCLLSIAGFASLTGVTWAQPPGGDKDLRRVVPPGQANARIALLIANADYPESPLPNTLNDADDMAQALRKLGFTVTVGKDWNRRKIEEGIRKFGKDAQGSGIALFYYSGHGVQFEGRNFLVPCAHNIEKEADIPFEAVDAQRVLSEMQEAGSRCNLLVLDACRNRPGLGGSGKGLLADKGLAPMHGPVGTVIAYATSPGNTASANRDQRNSLYTQELLKNLQTPGMRIGELFMKTRASVRALSGGKQIPWEESSLENDIVLTEKGKGDVPDGGEIVNTRARLSVITTPSSAVVTVDGQAATGNEWLLNLLDDDKKTVEVKVIAPGYEGQVRKVTLTRGSITPLNIRLATTTRPLPKPVKNSANVARLLGADTHVTTPTGAKGLLNALNDQVPKLVEADTTGFSKPYMQADAAVIDAVNGKTTYALLSLGFLTPPQQASPLRHIAEAQALSGTLGELKAGSTVMTLSGLVKDAKTPTDKFLILTELSLALAHTGNPEQGAKEAALAEVMMKSIPKEQPYGVEYLVGAYAACGKFDEAESLLGRMTHLRDKGVAQAGLARGEAENGRIDAARRRLARIEKDVSGTAYYGWCAVAQAEAKAGNSERALAVLNESIPRVEANSTPFARALGFAFLARSSSLIGQKDQAELLLRRALAETDAITTGISQTAVLSEVACVLAILAKP